MAKNRFQFKAIYYSICLGLLTLLFVTGVFPITTRAFPSSSLQDGITLYEAGRFWEAATVWQQTVVEYESMDDRFNQALSLNYLSLAYQELGQWQEAEIAIAQSLSLLNCPTPGEVESCSPDTKAMRGAGNLVILAQVLNTQGSLLLERGKIEAALDTWEQAEKAYKAAGDEVGVLGSQINQAQALQTLGLYRRAQMLLEQVNQDLQSQADSLLKATGLRSLGVALQVVGNLEESQNVLTQSLEISQRLNSATDISATLFSLGNTARALQGFEAAVSYYQQAAATATNPLSKLEAQLNQLSLLVETQQQATADSLLPQIQSHFSNLPASRSAIYAQVNLAENLMKMGKGEELANYQGVAQILAGAVQQARQLKDFRAESYALGELGKLYVQTQQWLEARDLTEKALSLAQGIQAFDIAYRWQWQLSQILKEQGDLTGAIAANREAVHTLQSLRSDLVAINPDVQFSFRETVEPIYRHLVELLLQSTPGEEGKVSQKNLEEARLTIASLQLAELENFFREACLQPKSESIDQIDPKAAVIYPIILPDRLAVIVSLPQQPLRYYQTQLPQTEVENTLNQLLQSLNPAFPNKQRLHFSQQVYDWLIRPIETELAEGGIETLVFVPDGSLRNLPMAALHDGQHYLVETYNIALSLGLQLLEPRSLTQQTLKLLTGGLSEARHGFSALPAVEFELQQISSKVQSEVLLNQEFTSTTLQTGISATPFSVIHLATHGQFSSKAEDTFLLAWDGRINVKRLDQLLRTRYRQDINPIELLVLSACRTASGDKRAVLGLAGLAVRSGARSTLATLWSVRDQSTAELMAEFYRVLTQPKMTKTAALRQAQLTLLQQPEYQHPFYWAPFVLVGNWL